MTADPTRLALALALLCAYAALCAWVWRRDRQRLARRHSAVGQAAHGGAAVLVAYASQTGHAEELATQTATTLAAAGLAVRLSRLADVDAALLQASQQALFIVSTSGEGDAPDEALAFVVQRMAAGLPLPGLRYGLLALGDSSYVNFCAFGRRLDAWLQQQGAQALFERIEADRGALPALQAWQQQLRLLAGGAPALAAPETGFTEWRLTARQAMNPGSAGAPLFLLGLRPASGALPHWESGDLVQILAPADPERPREYSIASVPADGCVQLMVRLRTGAGGHTGVASGWLTQQAQPGDAVSLHLRQHPRFRLGGNAERPLLLIGAGSGLAGLRSHLKARVQRGERRNWLIFGERQSAFDSLCRDELQHWQAGGWIERLDLVFSRDAAQRDYVQHRLQARRAELLQWLQQGAAVYVCGSRVGMGEAVHASLQDLVGHDELEALREQGRYRRDVY